MRSPRLLVILVIGGVAAILIGVLVFQSMRNNQPATNVAKQTVHLQMPENTIVDIYQSNEDILEGTTDAVEPIGEPVITVQQSQDLQLAQGVYLVRTREHPDYKTFSDALIVSQQPVELTISRDFTEKKLQSLLAKETPAVHQAIIKANPQIAQLYNIQPGWLYKQGDWYATKLIYKGSNPAQADTLRLVAHKQDGAWQLVTTPPDITISGLRYPQIPADVLLDINNFK